MLLSTNADYETPDEAVKALEDIVAEVRKMV
jgi:hypothetical protein